MLLQVQVIFYSINEPSLNNLDMDKRVKKDNIKRTFVKFHNLINKSHQSQQIYHF